MTSTLLRDQAVAWALRADDPEERFISTGVDWQHYEGLLTRLGDSARYRVTYLEGVLEIMSPSRQHELQKKISAVYSKPTLKRPVHAFGGWVPPPSVDKNSKAEPSRTSVIAWVKKRHFPI